MCKKSAEPFFNKGDAKGENLKMNFREMGDERT